MGIEIGQDENSSEVEFAGTEKWSYEGKESYFGQEDTGLLIGPRYCGALVLKYASFWNCFVICEQKTP